MKSSTPLEPTLFPKLRVYFADFPYLHCSYWTEAVHLEDLMRLSVRHGVKSLQIDFQGLMAAFWTPGMPRRSAHRHLFLPIIGFHRVHEQVKQKRKLCPAPPQTSPPQCVSPLSHPCAGILTCFPFADRKNDCHPA